MLFMVVNLKVKLRGAYSGVTNPHPLLPPSSTTLKASEKIPSLFLPILDTLQDDVGNVAFIVYPTLLMAQKGFKEILIYFV